MTSIVNKGQSFERQSVQKIRPRSEASGPTEVAELSARLTFGIWEIVGSGDGLYLVFDTPSESLQETFTDKIV